MNAIDYVLIALIAAAIIGAFIVCIRNRKKGKTCCGDCLNCHSGCGEK